MKLIYLFIFLMQLTSCSDDSLPKTELPRLTSAVLEDFNFNQNLDYMEYRLVYYDGPDSDPDDFEVLAEFNPELKLNLTQTQQLYLGQARSIQGVGYGCMPWSCKYYFVTVAGDIVNVVDNEFDLLSLIAEIDTPAELHLLFLSHSHYPLFYEVIETGYRVVAGWGDCNGNSGEDLFNVDKVGNITLVRTLTKKQENVAC